MCHGSQSAAAARGRKEEVECIHLQVGVHIMRDRRVANRREFLTMCLVGVAARAAGDRSLPVEASNAPQRPSVSTVCVARDAKLRDPGGNVDSTRIFSLLDRAMEGLFGAGDPAKSWAKVAHAGQLVALKVNTLGGHGLSSNVQLVEAICERLQFSGVRAQEIVIFDRDSEEMERAGFRIRTGGNQVQCFGTDRVGFEDELSQYGEVGSRISKILTRRCDLLINVPVLKDHDGAGVSIALKNMYGVIHNPNKYHPNGCDPYIADVNMLPEIRSRLCLHICDATTACYEGGPAFKPQFAWLENALIVSADPVALDQTGWQMIEQKRALEGLKTLAADGRAPRYIATAANAGHRLGVCDARRISLIERQVA
jgi:uncharacterized protein (DUF362 family)